MIFTNIISSGLYPTKRCGQLALIHSRSYTRKSYISEAYNVPPINYDEFNQPSSIPTPHYKIIPKESSALQGENTFQNIPPEHNHVIEHHQKRNNPFKRSKRFSLQGLNQDESQDSKPFWQELMEREAIEKAKHHKNATNKYFSRLKQISIKSNDTFGPRSRELKKKSPADQSRQALYTESSFENQSISSLDSLSIQGNIGDYDSSTKIINREVHLNDTIVGIQDVISSNSGQDPIHLGLHNQIKFANSPFEIFSHITDHSEIITPEVLALSISRISYTMNRNERNMVLKHPKYELILDRIQDEIDNFTGHELCGLLLAFQRLQYFPSWHDKIINNCSLSIGTLDVQDMSTCISVCLQIPIQSQITKYFYNSLIKHLEHRLQNSSLTTQNISSITKSLGWANSIPESLMVLISNRIEENIVDFTPSQLSTLIRTLAKLNLKDHKLGKKFSDQVSKFIKDFTIQEIVKVTWGLSKMEATHEEFYKLFISPTLRGFLPQFEMKDLSVILHSYANANVYDSEFTQDLVRHIHPFISQLQPNELTEVVSSLVRLNYQNSTTFNSLKNRSVFLVESFTPIKLVKNIYSFSLAGVTDSKYYYTMCNKAIDDLQILKPIYLFRILSALLEVEYLSHPITDTILDILDKASFKSIFVEEAVIALKCLSKTQHHLSKRNFIEKLFTQVYQREKAWRCLTRSNVYHLIECQTNMKHYDHRLLRLLYQRFHRFIGGDDPINFYKIITVTSTLPYYQRHVLKNQISKQSEIFNTISSCILNFYNNLEFNLQKHISLLYALAKIGFESKTTLRMEDDICHKIDTKQFHPSASSLSQFLWAQLQMKHNLDWCEKMIPSLLEQIENSYENDKDDGVSQSICEDFNKRLIDNSSIMPKMSGENLTNLQQDEILLVLWSSIVVGKLKKALFLLDIAASTFSQSIPIEVELAQQIAFEIDNSKECMTISKTSRQWIKELLKYSNYSLHKKLSFSKNDKISQDQLFPYVDWISQTLVKLKIPFLRNHMIEKVYLFPAAIPQKKHLIDVIDIMDTKLTDLESSQLQEDTLTSTDFRLKHAADLGWTVHSIKLRDLEKFKKHDKLNDFIQEIVASNNH